MSDENAADPVIEVELDDEQPGLPYPDTIEGPDAAWHFGGDAQEFLIHWCAAVGCDVKGSAYSIGENGSLVILLSSTGEILTPLEIAKRINKGKVRSLSDGKRQ